jgi:uncharacterized protein YuzE
MQQTGDTFSISDCTIDLEADAMYIPFKPVETGEVVANVMVEDPRISGYVVLDLDKSNRLVGIEIIGVSEVVASSIPELRADTNSPP